MSVGENQVSKIGPGLLVLLGITHDDTTVEMEQLGNKLLNIRLWHEGDKRWAKSVT